jgi:type 1 glutamine amidotransferase
MKPYSLILCAFGLAVAATLSATADASAEDKKATVLFVSQSAGYRHGSVNRGDKELAPAEIAMTQLGQQSGLFEVHCTQDCAADFTKENLQKYDMVMFYTTGKLPIAEADLDYFFKEWLTQKGHGVVGFHSATDTFKKYKPYWDMIGGSFTGHPWGSGNTVTIAVHEPNHPAMKAFGGSSFQIKDEIYRYKNWQPEKVRVLMSLDMSKCKPSEPYHVPVAWVKEYGKGRMFYTNLGHNNGTWTDKRFIESVTGGIRWVMGLEEADATPNPKVSAKEEEKAKAASGK